MSNSLFLVWGDFMCEKEEKKVETPLIDLAEKVARKTVELGFRVLRSIVKEAKRLLTND